MAKISKIISSCGSDNPVRPVLVDFQNGVVNTGQEKNLECGLFEDPSSDTRYCAVSNGNLTYAGTVDSEDLYRNFILVHNKKKNKITLIEVDHCTLAPIFDKQEYALDTSVTDDAMNDLNRTFGSKRVKRQTEQKNRYKMNIDSVKDKLESTVSNVNVDDSLLTNSTEVDNPISYIYPKINRQASSVEQVYSLEDLVPLDVLESLQEEAVQILESNLAEIEGLSQFVASNIAHLQSSTGSSEVKVRKCCILLYIHYIIKLMVTHLKQLTKFAKICETSPKVDEHIKGTFLIRAKGHWQRPMSMKDKSLSYILVLSIFGVDYSFDVELLVKDTRVSIKKMVEIARILAFVADKSVVKLKMPLPPVLKLNKRRKTM